MGHVFKNLLRRFAERSGQAPANPLTEPKPIPEVQAPTQPADDVPKAAAMGLGTGDAQLKMESARCDLHPLYRLAAAVIKVSGPPGADISPISALRCTRSACDRHYTPHYGYFSLVDFERPNLRDSEGRLTCSLIHEPWYMLVAKSSEAFLWVCPEPDCLVGVPYHEP